MKKIYLSAEPFCGNGYVLVDNMFFKFKGNKLVMDAEIGVTHENTEVK